MAGGAREARRAVAKERPMCRDADRARVGLARRAGGPAARRRGTAVARVREAARCVSSCPSRTLAISLSCLRLPGVSLIRASAIARRRRRRRRRRRPGPGRSAGWITRGARAQARSKRQERLEIARSSPLGADLAVDDCSGGRARALTGPVPPAQTASERVPGRRSVSAVEADVAVAPRRDVAPGPTPVCSATRAAWRQAERSDPEPAGSDPRPGASSSTSCSMP